MKINLIAFSCKLPDLSRYWLGNEQNIIYRIGVQMF